MSVRIRLARIGKKKAPFFRIVAIDKRNKRDGEYLENLGTYNPLTGEFVQFHADKIQAWVDKGAVLSETVVKLQKQFARGAKAPVAEKGTVKKVLKAKKPVSVEPSATHTEQAQAESGK